jgi:hypothetical protein
VFPDWSRIYTSRALRLKHQSGERCCCRAGRALRERTTSRISKYFKGQQN